MRNAAFKTLDIYDTGCVSIHTFGQLVQRVKRRRLPNYHILTLYSILDTDGDGYLTQNEFNEICDVLLLTISREDVELDPSTSLLTIIKEYGLRMTCLAIIQRPFYHSIRAVLIFADTFALFCLEVVRLTQPNRSNPDCSWRSVIAELFSGQLL